MFITFAFISTIIAQSGSSDEDQIKKIIDKLCVMWTDPKGIQIARAITAKNVISIG
jgi:hypothetical protein